MNEKQNESGLTLDDNHIYRWNGVVVPGVNETLQHAGLKRPFFRSAPWALERGTIVHRALAALDSGEAVIEDFVPPWRQYAEQWKKVVGNYNLRFKQIEEPLMDTNLWIAGTVDRAGRFGEGREFVLDIKTHSVDGATRWQLSGYSHLLGGNTAARERIAVCLWPDRHAVMIYPSRMNVTDLHTFRAAVRRINRERASRACAVAAPTFVSRFLIVGEGEEKTHEHS